MSLSLMQKQPLYWFDENGHIASRLTLSQLGSVPSTDLPITPSNEKPALIGVCLQFDQSNQSNVTKIDGDVNIFVAQPCKAFAQSQSNLFSQLAAQIEMQEKAAVHSVLDHATTQPVSFFAKAPLKYDEMLLGVGLRKYISENFYQIEIFVQQSDAKRQSLDVLQRVLTFCLAHAANTEKSAFTFITESDVKLLNLYSFAWVCSVLKTMSFHYYAAQMEKLFVRNLEYFYKHCKRGKDFLLFVMFVCSLAVRRTQTMQMVLQFVIKNDFYTEMKSVCDKFENSFEAILESPGVASDRKSLQKTFRKTVRHLIKLLEPHCVSTVSTVVVPKIDNKAAHQLICLVDIFVSWLDKLVKSTTVNQRNEFCTSKVYFDQLECKIECSHDSPLVYKRYICTRLNDKRRAKYSLSDLNEWLRYMVLLQLDERNIHKQTQFLIKVSPQIVNFGPAPRLTFVDGVDFLTYFLLKSEYVRATFHQDRPKLLEIRKQMSLDFTEFLNTDNCIILNKQLLQQVTQKYALKTIQGVSLNSFY